MISCFFRSEKNENNEEMKQDKEVEEPIHIFQAKSKTSNSYSVTNCYLHTKKQMNPLVLALHYYISY